jgi:Ca2+-binding RTX toxin-like protein
MSHRTLLNRSLQLLRTRSSRRSQQRRSNAAGQAGTRAGRTVTVRTFESLDARTLLAADLGMIDEGLQSGYFTELQSMLNDQVLSVPAPLIGNALAGELGGAGSAQSQFLTSINNRLQSLEFDTSATVADVRASLADALTVSPDAIQVTGQDGDGEITFQVELTETQSFQRAVDLDLAGADPEIELLLGTEDQVDLLLTWNYDLRFGVREDAAGISEFFVDDSGLAEITIDYTATIRDDFASGKGRVGVFIAEMAAGEEASQFSGTYTLDVATDEHGKATVAGSLIGAGDAHLDIVGSLFPSFLPADDDNLVNLAVTSEGHVNYQTQLAFGADGSVDSTDNLVTVAIRNVQLDLGKIYHDFVDPLIGQLQENLRPIKPVVDFLTTPLPVISDLYEMAGQGPVTALTLAGYGPQSALAKTLRTVDAILDYRGLPGAGDTANETLFSLEVSKSGVDPQTQEDRQERIQKTLDKLDRGEIPLELADKYKNPAEHAEWQAGFAWNAEFNSSIGLPFLQDFNTLAGLMLGDTSSELFTFDLNASFNFDAHVDIPIVPLLNMVSVTGRIGFGLDLNLDGGYDATGIKRLTDAADFSSEQALNDSIASHTGLLMHGFYLDDHLTDGFADNSHQDQPEAVLSVELGAGLKAGLDLLIMQFELGGEVVLEGDLLFDLNDLPEPALWSGETPIWSNVLCHNAACTSNNSSEWTYDGRVRVPEMVRIMDADPGALFNLDGALRAGVDTTLDVSLLGFSIISERWELARVTLIDGNIAQPNDALLIHGENPPQLGTVNDGLLSLFVGDQAYRRNRAAGMIDEHVQIQSLGASKGGGETVMVTLQEGDEAHTQYFHGVSRIEAHGGSGDDRIIATAGITADVRWSGGAGNDLLSYAGNGVALLYGNDGNDTLVGGSNADLLDGGAGDDTLDGGSGNDLLYGGDGHDRLEGKAGDDELHGGAGNDVLHGGHGDDLLRGGDGHDTLRGGEGSDTIHGEAGDDVIQYGVFLRDRDSLDVIRGGANNDTIEIYGTERDDHFVLEQLDGGTFQVTNGINGYFNFSLPEAVTDRDIEQLQVSGLGGDDTIQAIGLFNVNLLRLDGGDGNDTIIGADSRNLLIGGDGDDVLTGGADHDILRGGAGNDVLNGGAGNDALYGDDGDDMLSGGEGFDTSYGGEGNDTILANDGAIGDLMYGEAGDDILVGGDGVDLMFGGDGNDVLNGGAGGDLLDGGAGNDRLIGGTGRDMLLGGDGDDHLFALSDSDESGDAESLVDWRSAYNTLLGREMLIFHFELPELQKQEAATLQAIADLEATDPDNIRLPRLRAELDEIRETMQARYNELAVINVTQNDINPYQQVNVDVLEGGAGDDHLFGSPYHDRLVGGAGNDVIQHSAGNDFVSGGEGAQDQYIVLGTNQADTILVELVEDAAGGTPTVVVSQAGMVTRANHLGIEIVGVRSLGGDDTIELRFGLNAAMAAIVDAGSGNDTINLDTFQHHATVDGGEGTDRLIARLGADDDRFTLTDTQLVTSQLEHQIANFEFATLIGNDLDNTLDARDFSGSVHLQGLGGNDRLVTAGGNDVVDGGDGHDTVVAEANVNFRLTDTMLFGQGNDRLESVEAAELIGGAGNNTLDATAFTRGNVILRGGAGDDRLLGGRGNDQLFGGDGDDWLEDNFDSVDYLYGGNGNDRLRGINDYLFGEAGDDILRVSDPKTTRTNRRMSGGAGDDQLYGAMGNDVLHGDAGNDAIFASGGHDTLYGGDGNDLLYGADGNDRIYGGKGNDQLYGHAGNDTLYGGDGNDLLRGGNGRDRLYGGSGNDSLDGGRDGTQDVLDGGPGTDSATQYRRWITTWGPFGYWQNQESLTSIETVNIRNQW